MRRTAWINDSMAASESITIAREAAVTDEISDRVKAQKDLLWGMYSDVRTHARHAETLRSNAVNYVFVITSVLVAVIFSDGKVERAELPLCLVLVLIGLLGLAFVASYTELYQRNRQRAERFRTVLDSRFFADGDTTVAGLLDEADQDHEATRLYRWSREVIGSSHRFWLLLPMLVIAVGVLLTAMAAG